MGNVASGSRSTVRCTELNSGSAQAVLQLETAMAREMWDRTVSRNRDLTYNKLSRSELAALAPGGVANWTTKPSAVRFTTA